MPVIEVHGPDGQVYRIPYEGQRPSDAQIASYIRSQKASTPSGGGFFNAPLDQVNRPVADTLPSSAGRGTDLAALPAPISPDMDIAARARQRITPPVTTGYLSRKRDPRRTIQDRETAKADAAQRAAVVAGLNSYANAALPDDAALDRAMDPNLPGQTGRLPGFEQGAGDIAFTALDQAPEVWGGLVGNGLGSFLGPVGMIKGGEIAQDLVHRAKSALEERFLSPQDRTALEADRARIYGRNPLGVAGIDLALSGGLGRAGIAARALNGVIGAGLDAVNQYGQTGEVDPLRTLISGGMGAAQGHNEFAGGLMEAGAAVPGAVGKVGEIGAAASRVAGRMPGGLDPTAGFEDAYRGPIPAGDVARRLPILSANPSLLRDPLQGNTPSMGADYRNTEFPLPPPRNPVAVHDAQGNLRGYVEAQDPNLELAGVGQRTGSPKARVKVPPSIAEAPTADELRATLPGVKRSPIRHVLGEEDVQPIDGKPLVVVPTFADRAKVGEYFNPESGVRRQLMGGFEFPLIDELYGLGGWAHEGDSTYLGNIRKAVAMGGHPVGAVILQDPTAVLGNKDAHAIYSQELEHSLKTAPIDDVSARLLIKAAQAKIEKDVKSKGPETRRVLATDYGSDLQKFWDDLHGTNFQARNVAMRKIGGQAGQALGLPRYQMIMQGMNDPRIATEQHAPNGSIVSLINLHPGGGDYGNISADQLGVPGHPSYKNLIIGQGLGNFARPVPLQEMYRQLFAREGVPAEKWWSRVYFGKQGEGKPIEALDPTALHPYLGRGDLNGDKIYSIGSGTSAPDGGGRPGDRPGQAEAGQPAASDGERPRAVIPVKNERTPSSELAGAEAGPGLSGAEYPTTRQSDGSHTFKEDPALEEALNAEKPSPRGTNSTEPAEGFSSPDDARARIQAERDAELAQRRQAEKEQNLADRQENREQERRRLASAASKPGVFDVGGIGGMPPKPMPIKARVWFVNRASASDRPSADKDVLSLNTNREALRSYPDKSIWSGDVYFEKPWIIPDYSGANTHAIDPDSREGRVLGQALDTILRDGRAEAEGQPKDVDGKNWLSRHMDELDYALASWRAGEQPTPISRSLLHVMPYPELAQAAHDAGYDSILINSTGGNRIIIPAMDTNGRGNNTNLLRIPFYRLSETGFDDAFPKLDKSKAGAMYADATGAMAAKWTLQTAWQKLKDLAAREKQDPSVKPLKDDEYSSALETISAYRKAGLLSNPVTHIRNQAANATFQVMEEAASIPAALADMAISAVAGTERTYGLPSAAGVANALKVAATKGVKEAVEIVRTGKVEGDVMDPEQTDKALEAAGVSRELRSQWIGSGLFDPATNMVFRITEAGDRPFKIFAYVRSLEAQARLMAQNEAKRARAAGQTLDVKARRQELLGEPTEAMKAQAQYDALEATFQGENTVGLAAKRVRAALSDPSKGNPLLALAVDTVVPFTGVPTNVVLRTMEYALGAGIAPVQAGSAIAKQRKAEAAGVFKRAEDARTAEAAAAEDRRAAQETARSANQAVRSAQAGLRSAVERQAGDPRADQPTMPYVDQAQFKLKGARASAEAAGESLAGARERHKASQEELKAAAEAAANAAMTPEQQRNFARTFGRGLVGPALMALGWYLAKGGAMTGYSDNDAEKKKREKTGIPEASIRMAGRWLQLGFTGPAGAMLAIGATAYERRDEYAGADGFDPWALMWRGAAEAGRVVGEAPFLKAGEQLPTKGDPEGTKRYAVQQGLSYAVPASGLLRGAAAAMDTQPRTAETPADQLKKGIPLMRNTLPANPKGQSVQGPGALLDPTSSKPGPASDPDVYAGGIVRDKIRDRLVDAALARMTPDQRAAVDRGKLKEQLGRNAGKGHWFDDKGKMRSFDMTPPQLRARLKQMVESANKT